MTLKLRAASPVQQTPTAPASSQQQQRQRVQKHSTQPAEVPLASGQHIISEAGSASAARQAISVPSVPSAAQPAALSRGWRGPRQAKSKPAPPPEDAIQQLFARVRSLPLHALCIQWWQRSEPLFCQNVVVAAARDESAA